MLLLRPVGPFDGKAAGKTRIGIDRAQAGVGDRVLVIDEGQSGRQLMNEPKGAVKTIVVGIVDYVERAGNSPHDHQRRIDGQQPHRRALPGRERPRPPPGSDRLPRLITGRAQGGREHAVRLPCWHLGKSCFGFTAQKHYSSRSTSA